MAYKVAKTFLDAEDNKRLCREGDIYPRGGFEVAKERLGYLESNGWIKKEDENDLDAAKMTVSELKNALDEAGIAYDEKAKKADLLKLLEG